MSRPASEPVWLRETRESYDEVATSYAELLADELAEQTWDRAVLAAFAELVPPGTTVADLGCGPGRITAHLAGLGLAVRGMDLSPGMVAEATRRHPDLDFEVADLARLPLAEASLGGVVAWYSLIHTPDDRLPAVLGELARALVPGGQLVTAFQVGDEVVRVRQGYGHSIGLDAWRRQPAQLERILGEAGLAVHTRVVREPVGPEKTQRAYLVARREG